jgi:choline-glycine betaine transporter
MHNARRQPKLRRVTGAQPMLSGWIWALALTIIGGLVLLAGELTSLPAALVLSGLGVFLLGVALVFALAVAESRRTGQGIIRSLWAGATASLRWLWEFLP